ncbi:hypothetical protein M434DRAFT_37847 [Hypoxylon sp. CO27-5]|nr:hypothetical protein M434DRAFT_37847 [Hypoxylon sp. CO27-5]
MRGTEIWTLIRRQVYVSGREKSLNLLCEGGVLSRPLANKKDRGIAPNCCADENSTDEPAQTRCREGSRPLNGAVTCTPVDRRTGRPGRERKERRHSGGKVRRMGEKIFSKVFWDYTADTRSGITTARFCSTTEVVETVLSLGRLGICAVYFKQFRAKFLLELGTSLDFTRFDNASCACVYNFYALICSIINGTVPPHEITTFEEGKKPASLVLGLMKSESLNRVRGTGKD